MHPYILINESWFKKKNTCIVQKSIEYRVVEITDICTSVYLYIIDLYINVFYPA